MQSFKVVIDKHSDTSNVLYKAITSVEAIKVMHYDTDDEMKADLNKGRLVGVILITKNNETTANPYSLILKSCK